MLSADCFLPVLANKRTYRQIKNIFLQCFDTVVSAPGRASGLQKVSDGVLLCLSGARCRLFADGPADATASLNPIISSFI